MDEAGSLRSAYRGQLQRIASLKRQLQDLDLGNGDDDEELRELEVTKFSEGGIQAETNVYRISQLAA